MANSRIETGRHTASQGTVDKIMRVIEAERRRLRSKKEKNGVRLEWHCRLRRKGLGEWAAAAGFEVSADEERGKPQYILRCRGKDG